MNYIDTCTRRIASIFANRHGSGAKLGASRALVRSYRSHIALHIAHHDSLMKPQ